MKTSSLQTFQWNLNVDTLRRGTKFVHETENSTESFHIFTTLLQTVALVSKRLILTQIVAKLRRTRLLTVGYCL